MDNLDAPQKKKAGKRCFPAFLAGTGKKRQKGKVA
jgi:hypothetical protein